MAAAESSLVGALLSSPSVPWPTEEPPNATAAAGCSTSMPVVAVLNQILYSIICVVGLLGNSLVIYVVLRFSRMQTVTNTYIVNLAIADEFFLIGIPFLIVTMSYKTWPFGKLMCEAYLISTSINQFTSSIFMLIMSADRYIAVCHPITEHKYRSPFISKLVSLTAWIASVVFMIPVFAYADLSQDGMCNVFWVDSQGHQTIFIMYSFALSFAIPLTLILLFYFLVIRKLKTVGPKHKSKEKKRSHRKVTRLVLTVITVYVICWLPYWCTQIALAYTPPNECHPPITVTVFLLAGSLSYSNSAINPILYAFLSENFKKSFVKACTCAAGADINATLHAENSVLPRRKLGTSSPHFGGGAEGGGGGGGAGAGGAAHPLQRTPVDADNYGGLQLLLAAAASSNNSTRNDDDDELLKDENELGLLISKASSTTLTMASRSNATISSENRSSSTGCCAPAGEPKERQLLPSRNGAQTTLLTQV